MFLLLHIKDQFICNSSEYDIMSSASYGCKLCVFWFRTNNYAQRGPVNEHSYLTAHVELTKRQQLLMLGQAYRINLHLEVPESPVNKEMGLFCV